MTSKQKKEYLSKYLKLDKLINRKLEEREHWRDMATKITGTFSDMPKASGGENRIETAVDHIAKLEHELNVAVSELTHLRKSIELSLQTVKDDTYRVLLEYRYIDGMTWEQISVKMSYTYQWVCKLHGRALQKIEIVDSN